MACEQTPTFIDEHPLLPTSRDVRGALDWMVEKNRQYRRQDHAVESPRSRSRLAGKDLHAAATVSFRH